MGTFELTQVGKPTPTEEMIHVNRNHKSVKAVLKRFIYRDKDTRQIVIYIPSLEISGYGATLEKAIEMVQFSMDEYFTYLISLSAKEMKIELLKNEWQHNDTYNNKKYSKAYIDSDGILQNFNAVADEVEVGVLTY